MSKTRRSIRFHPLVFFVLTMSAALFAPASSQAATYSWNASAAVSTWQVSSNWGGTVPGSGDVAAFPAASYSATASTPTLSSPANLGGIWDTGAGAVTVAGSAITLFGTAINGNVPIGIELDASAGPLAINAPLVVQNNQQWINNSLNSITVNGNISGTGNLTILGSGILTLTGSNDLGVELTVDGGTIQVPSGFLSMTSPGNGWEYIGNSHTGSFVELGGKNWLANGLVLGNNPGSRGSYGLSGNGVLTASQEYSGFSGSGTFNQTGGSNSFATELI
jgi:hypothetical protein